MTKITNNGRTYEVKNNIKIKNEIMIKAVNFAESTVFFSSPTEKAKLYTYIDKLNSIEDATWWINNKDLDYKGYLKLARAMMI
jgi:hypothetical protein